MAKETAYEKQVREALELLPHIVAATHSELGYMFTNFKLNGYLVQQGFVEVNAELANEAGDEATRATQAGIDFVNANGTVIVETPAYVAPAVSEVPATAVIQAEVPIKKEIKKMAFEIENIPVEASKRGVGSRVAKYPFASLEVGQSFFIPGEKFSASTLSNAMKPYDVPVTNEDGSPKMKTITVPRTGEKREIQCTQHVRIFTAVQAVREVEGVAVNGYRVGRTQ